MKAVICSGYGKPEVLQIKELDVPRIGDDDLLVKNVAASVTKADVMMRQGTPFYARIFLGLTKPRHPVPGTGFAGIVESVGKNVTSFKPGDEVFGETGVDFGGYAEYVRVSRHGVITHKPENLSFEDAATICDGPLTSYSFLRDVGKLKKGQHVLVNGASGSLGSAAVQLAKIMGSNVTGVCSTKNVSLVQSLGADQVIDYTHEDFTEGMRKYDLIFDSIGKSSFSHCRSVLKENGTYMSPVLKMSLVFQMIRTGLIGRQAAKFSATGMRPAHELNPLLCDLVRFSQLGKIKIITDKIYSLDDIVEAHKYVEAGHKVGNVVLKLNNVN